MILDDLVAATQKRLIREKADISPAAMHDQALATPAPQAAALLPARLHQHFGIIAECKQASPSKGQIATSFPVTQIASEYEAAGVDAISVLTEPDYFHGQLADLKAVTQTVKTPVLRKDFTIDRYMIDQARASGATMVLLIAAILPGQQLTDLYDYTLKMGLLPLVECHSEDEISRALPLHPQLMGVNNRDLRDFSVDFQNSIRRRKLIPQDIAVIAESGVTKPSQLQELQAGGLNGTLIGETFMKAQDRVATIREYRRAVEKVQA
ncbi:indole-3-glycerol phosphate synthase TrpC [Lacticaseibacillus camelliae]|uniref:indole-3-glycerol-phosphate synthase n=1 Tax=Lacticaseibacillus camelliae DSM 22697 = JCM 13995 TaxID=1423730 RepID=A0A0R2ER79_9LACO|nr:indole-3-glycerol phosphate synthase TrpC [Lacticaseibacillus camelliae]KRN18766.1 indole-3-glycerol-phosphate synthase [Lacticaseibacillus camelliae DSM 22697 = JCM 13995]